MELHAGEVVALVGHNGAGKSTASKIIAGFVQPDNGELHIEDHAVDQWSQRESSRLGVALVPQQFAIVPDLTVRENITLGRAASPQAVTRAAQALGLVDVLDVSAQDVSPATHRLTMIGRALVRDPKIIILDEPSAAFSRTETERLFAIVDALRKEGIAFIYISHRLQEVLDIADRVIGMSAGRIICDAPSADMTKDELADIISGSHATRTGGQTAEQVRRRKRAAAQEIMLQVSELSTPQKLRDVSFQVHRGEVLGITGLIGAGRSSLLNTLWGVYGVPDVAKVELAGSPFSPKSPEHSVRSGLAYVPEGRMRTSIIPDLDVTDNVTIATLRAGARLKSPLIDRRAEQRRVTEVLSRIDTKPATAARMHVGELSGGNQQKVVIARWLLSDAEVFMFDEPSEGVDIGARQEIYAALRALALKGAAVIVSSSDVEEIVEYADRILVMHDGTIVEEIPEDKQNVEYVSRACL
jgi:ABC-type sugar transport system ATPase subunit